MIQIEVPFETHSTLTLTYFLSPENYSDYGNDIYDIYMYNKIKTKTQVYSVCFGFFVIFESLMCYNLSNK